MTRNCAVDLTVDLSAPRVARRVVCLLLTQWGVSDQDLLDGAAIVVSELVTNVLVHCDDGGPLTVAVELDEAHVRVAVTDCGPGVPAQRAASRDDEGGRGLSIVGQLATRWGTEPTAGGKRVFAELPRSQPICA